MINKLLIIGKSKVTSTIVDDLGLTNFVKKSPMAIAPKAWPEEAGITHYGFFLEGMKLNEWQKVTPAIHQLGNANILEWDGVQEPNIPLKSVGLHVHPSA